MKSFGQVYENHIHRMKLLNAFLLELSKWKHHVFCISRGAKSYTDTEWEFCQQPDELWARDEQKFFQECTEARCHDNCCNAYDHPCSCINYREMLLLSLKSCGRQHLFQQLKNMQKSTIGEGLPQHFRILRQDWLISIISIKSSNANKKNQAKNQMQFWSFVWFLWHI